MRDSIISISRIKILVLSISAILWAAATIPTYAQFSVQTKTEIQDSEQPVAAPSDDATQSRERLVSEHDLTDLGELVAVDLLHGEGSQRLRVERSWSGAGSGDGHFGRGWQDSNIIRLRRETDKLVTITRGPVVWITATGKGDGAFTSRAGHTIQVGDDESVVAFKSGATWIFNGDGQLVTMQPKIGPVAEFIWSTEGQLQEISLGERNALRYLYDNNRVILIEGPEGLHVEYVYEGDRLVEVVNGWNHRIKYNYNEEGTLVSAVDQYANVTSMPVLRNDTFNEPVPNVEDETSDKSDNDETTDASSPAKGAAPPTDAVEKSVEPADATDNQSEAESIAGNDASRSADKRTYRLPPAPIQKFDNLGRITRIEERGRTFEYAYDDDGQLLSESAADGTTEWTYDVFGRVQTVQQPNGTRLTLEYNKHDQPIRIDSSTGEWNVFEYNENGDLFLEAGSDGHSTTYGYDTHGRLSSEQPNIGVSKQYTYNSDDDLIGIRYSDGREVSLLYDIAGRRVATTWSTGQYAVRTYGPNGRLLSKDVNGLVTTYGYNEQGQLETITDPIHGEKKFDSSKDEEKGLSLTWGETTWSRQTNEWLDPVESTISGDGVERRSMYLYHRTGEISDVGSAAGRFWSYHYDDAGRQVRIELPGGQGIDLERDHAGRLTKVTRDGVDYRTYVYDAAGRLQMETTPRGVATVYSWDKAGRVREVIEPNGKVQYEYDDRGLATSISSNDYQISQEHRPDGSLARRNYETAGLDLQFPVDESGRSGGISLNDIEVRYEYDEFSRVNSIVLPNDARIWILRDEAGRPTEITFGDNSRMGLTWDHRDRVTSVGTSTGSNNFLTFLEQYNYDAAGNLTNVQSLDQPAREYGYDADDRLTSVETEIASTTYEYDDNDNLSAVETGGVRQSWELDSGGRPRYLGTRTSYIWDEFGNLSTIDDTNMNVGNSFDAAGRLVHRKSGDFEWTFGYLPDGDRLWQEGPQGRTWYAYLPEGLTAFRDEAGTPWLIVNLPGTDRPLALCGPDGATLFVVTDHLHSIRKILDPDGQVLSATEYGEFGQVADNVGSAPLAMYAGMVRDNHGLYYARRRYYDPALLRFISIDPWTGTHEFPASHNSYAYAANNPLKYRDPTGAFADDRRILYWGDYDLESLDDEMLDLHYRDLLEKERAHLLATNRERGLERRLRASGLDPESHWGRAIGNARGRTVWSLRRDIDAARDAIKARALQRRNNPRPAVGNSGGNAMPSSISSSPNASRPIGPVRRDTDGNLVAGEVLPEAEPFGDGKYARQRDARGDQNWANKGQATGPIRSDPKSSGNNQQSGSQTGTTPASGTGDAPKSDSQQSRSSKTNNSQNQPPSNNRNSNSGPPKSGSTKGGASGSKPPTSRSTAPTGGSPGTSGNRSIPGANQGPNTPANRSTLQTGSSSNAPSSRAAGGARTPRRPNPRNDRLLSRPNIPSSSVVSSVGRRLRGKANRELRESWLDTVKRLGKKYAKRIVGGGLLGLAAIALDAHDTAEDVRDGAELTKAIYNSVYDREMENILRREGKELAYNRLRAQDEAISQWQEQVRQIMNQQNDPNRQYDIIPGVAPDGTPADIDEQSLMNQVQLNVRQGLQPLAGIAQPREQSANRVDYTKSITEAKKLLAMRNAVWIKRYHDEDRAARALAEVEQRLKDAELWILADPEDFKKLKEPTERLAKLVEEVKKRMDPEDEQYLALIAELEDKLWEACRIGQYQPLRNSMRETLKKLPEFEANLARLRAEAEPKLEDWRVPMPELKEAMQDVRRLHRETVGMSDRLRDNEQNSDSLASMQAQLQAAKDFIDNGKLSEFESQERKLGDDAVQLLRPWSRTAEATNLIEQAQRKPEPPDNLLPPYERAAQPISQLESQLNELVKKQGEFPEDAVEIAKKAEETLARAESLEREFERDKKRDSTDWIKDSFKKMELCIEQIKDEAGLDTMVVDEDSQTATIGDFFATLDPTHAFDKQQWTLSLKEEEEKREADPAAPGEDAPEDDDSPFEKDQWTLSLTDPDPEKNSKPIVPAVPETPFQPKDFAIVAQPNREPSQPATKYPFEIARPPQRQPTQPATKHQGEILPQNTAKHNPEIPSQSTPHKNNAEIPTRLTIPQPQLVSVPDVRGLPAQQAEEVIKRVGLSPSFAMGAPAPNVPKQYHVYAQQPAPRARVLPRSGVRVVYYDKPSTQLIPPITRTPSQPGTKHPGEIPPQVTKNSPLGGKSPREIPTQQPTPSMATVPNVSGMTAGNASARIRQAGLNPRFKSGNDAPSQANSYRVYAQSPNAGQRVAKNSPVDVTIYGKHHTTPSVTNNTPPKPKTAKEIPSQSTPSPSMVSVPDVSGLRAGDASKRLREAGLTPKFQSGNDAPSDSESYKVYSQSPGSGQRVAKRTPVEVKIYGQYREAQVKVPDVTGMSHAQASSRLRSAGLVAKRVRGNAAPSRSKESEVYRQAPRAGQSVNKGSSVDVTVYKEMAVAAKKIPSGSKSMREIPEDFDPNKAKNRPNQTPRMVKIPRLSGKNYREAVRILKGVGLKAKTSFETIAYDKSKEKLVYYHVPWIGKSVPEGSTVELKVYRDMSAGNGTIAGTWKCTCGGTWMFNNNGASGRENGGRGSSVAWHRDFTGTLNGTNYQFKYTRKSGGGNVKDVHGTGVITFNKAFTKGNWRMTELGKTYEGSIIKDDGDGSTKSTFNKAGININNKTGETLYLNIRYRSDTSGAWKWHSTRTTVRSGYSGPLKDSGGTTIAATSIKISVRGASGRQYGDSTRNLMSDGPSYDADFMGMHQFNVELRK